MGESLTQPACPSCAAALPPGAAACPQCGRELELTSPASQPVRTRSSPQLPRSSSPQPPRSSSPQPPRSSSPPPRSSPVPPRSSPVPPRADAQVSTDVSPAYVPPLASASPLMDLPLDGAQTKNDRVALELPALTHEHTHPSLDPIPMVVTATAPAAAQLAEPTTPSGQPLADPLMPTAAILPQVAVANEATHLKLEPVAEGQQPLEPPKPPWALVLLGTSATAALVLALVLALMPADVPAVQVVEVPTVVEVKSAPAAEPAKPAPADEPGAAAVASAHPAPSYGDPTERKAAFYPEHPTEVVKRGIAPSRKPPAKGTLRVISTVRGNLVSAPLFVDHVAAGMTPKELKGLKPGTHLFEVLTDDGPPVTVHYPVTPDKRGKTGEILDIDITQDGESTGQRQLDARADRPMQAPNKRGGE